MPKATFASHLLMHSTNTSDQHGGRETDSFDESKKNAGQPQKNYEQDSNMKVAQKRGKEQLKRLQAQAEDQSERIEQGREAAERVREKELAIVEKEKAARGESTQKKDDTSESGQSDAEIGANPNQKDMGQQSGSKDQKGDQGADETAQQGKQQDKQPSQDSAQKSDTKQIEGKQPQGSAQKPDNKKADDKQEASGEKQKSSSPQAEPQGKKQQGDQKVDDSGDSAGNSLEGDDTAKDTRSKLPTAAQPRTELTGGKKAAELSDASKERRELRDTRPNPNKSEAENREEGQRQIEARRVPEDVEEGRPSPSNIGRTALLPSHETSGNWRDPQEQQLAQKAGSDEYLTENNPKPTANRMDEDTDNQLQRRGIVRQQDLENKLEEADQPGRTHSIQEALTYQRSKENDTPQQSSERQQMRQREEAGDNKSTADKIHQKGWREQNDPGKAYTQSKEGAEKQNKSDDDKQGTEDKRNQREISRRNLPESGINQSQNRGLYEEIARRKSGRTPFEQLDAFEQQSQGQPHGHNYGCDYVTDDVANIEQARSRTRQEEMEWRSRNQNGLDALHRIQSRQETAFQDFQERESQNRRGMFSGITHFASDKWNNLVHGNEHKKKSEEDQSWGKNEARATRKRSTQATPPASPTTPTSGRRALADTNQNQRGQNASPVQPAKKGWWIFGNLQHFAPDWRQDGQQRFIDTLTDDELSMMSL